MATWKSVTLFTGANTAKARSAQDDYQHAWVDGSDGSPAHRVIINAEGEIVSSVIGMPAPKFAAQFTGIDTTETNDQGTGVKRGKILLVCYTYVNKEGIESNPSPVSVLDSMQYTAKGYFTKDGINYDYPIEGGTYTYSNDIVGSIRSFTLNIPITDPSTDSVRIYVAEAEQVETYAPKTDYRLTLTRKVAKGAISISAIISAVPSIVSASYENDISPMGDDITIADGVSFISNSVNPLGFPSNPLAIWAITINNANGVNYVNRFHRIDLFDEGGEKPIGNEYLVGLNWDTENLDNIRMMDDDLTTPLAVFHYPKDAVITIPKEQEAPSGDSTFAELISGNPATTSSILIRARQSGSAGNDITFAAEYDKTVAVEQSIVKEYGDGSLAILTLKSVAGKYWVVLAIVKPDSYNDTLSVANVVDGEKNTITITLETSNTSGYPAVSTMQEISDLLQAEILEDGELYGIIESVTEEGDWGGDQVYSDYPWLVSFANIMQAITVTVTGTDIVVAVPFQHITATDTQRSSVTASQVAAAINNNEYASVLVIASQYIPGASGFFAIAAEDNLAGGSGTPEVEPTQDAQTRFLSLIKIPYMPANTSKTIYLVRFNTGALPSGYAGRFTRLKASGSVSDNEILLSTFYADHVTYNPISSEGTMLSNIENVGSLVSEDLRFSYAVGNAANMSTPRYIYNDMTHQITDTTDVLTEVGDNNAVIGIYDEYGLSTEPSVLFREAFPSRSAYSAENNRNRIIMPLSRTFPREGHMSGFAMIGYGGGGYINGALAAIRTIDSNESTDITGNGTRIMILLLADYNASQVNMGVQITRNTGYNAITPAIYPSNMYINGTMVADISSRSPMFYFMSWKVEEDRSIKYSLAMYWKGIYKESIDNAFTQETIDLDYWCVYEKHYRHGNNATLPLYPMACTVQSGEYINKTEQILSIARFMPIYPVAGIGAYSEVAASDASTPSLMLVNENVNIEALSLLQDSRPGRIQWGGYAGMPDLNEYAINENILRIAPMKSLMPTDEHNTILVFTKTNVYRLALLGNSADDCRVIKELSGLGLVNADCLVEISAGYAWLSPKGIIMLTERGLRNISDGIIDTNGVISLAYDRLKNWLWARTSTDSYVFQLDEGFRWMHKNTNHPSKFIGALDDAEGWLDYGDNVIYRHGDNPNVGDNKTRIVTRAIRLIKKLGRIKVVSKFASSSYTFSVKLHGSKITGNTAVSGSYTANTNAKVAVPAASADYAQLDLQGVNDVIAVEIENIDGR